MVKVEKKEDKDRNNTKNAQEAAFVNKINRPLRARKLVFPNYSS